MEDRAWRIEEGDGPLVAAAVHNGHAVRLEVEEALALAPAQRLREEDPFTGDWTEIAPTKIVGLRSRFEVDLNRPLDKAVYLKPEDAWGLDVWKNGPAPTLVDRSLAEYDAFYAEMADVLDRKARQHGRFVVFDLHSYNHRRKGPDAEPDDPHLNPDVNVGTGTLDHDRWGHVVDAFIEALRGVDFMGRKLDVRENIKFFGGHLSRWVHSTYPESGCTLAIEFKKFFMDEWTGEPNREALRAIEKALRETIPPVLEALHALRPA
jgi:N-formylglutamate amidohydrolase